MINMAIHFGAGAIGRGFIGKLLADAGWDLVFVDVNEPLISYLKKNPKYRVYIATADKKCESVTVADAVMLSDTTKILKMGEKANLLTCAVGPSVLPNLAKTIAEIIQKRKEQGVESLLSVIACENMIRASSSLKQYVLENLDATSHAYLDHHVAFIDSAVDRIVPPQGSAELPSDVLVEEFYEWILDQNQIKDGFSIAGAQHADNLLAYIERKLFIVNGGHAACAYFGYLHGDQTIKESIDNPKIYQHVEHLMKESAATLVSEYSMDPKMLEEYIQKILHRFTNPYLRDEVTRVGRNPLRKLAPNERFVLPLQRTEQYGLPNKYLIMAIATTLLFDYAEDVEARNLQSQLQSDTVADVLNRITNNVLSSSTVEQICKEYDLLKIVKDS